MIPGTIGERINDIGWAEALNRDCLCTTVDPVALDRELRAMVGDSTLYRWIADHRPHLFCASSVFLSPAHAAEITRIVHAVEMAVATPGYQAHALARAPRIASHDSGSRGVFLGFDFHLSPDGPRLIEINTNAGGALLNAVLARAQRACCPEMRELLSGGVGLASLEDTVFDMFLAEWRAARSGQRLERVAIIDDRPMDQYLYPEFVLFQQLFARRGVEAAIVDPSDLVASDGRLWYAKRPVDLVYNRLTDFAFSEPSHAVIAAAYTQDAAVITPHPRAHALYADKRNLVALSDAARLEAWGIAAEAAALLSRAIPRTVPVTRADADTLWQNRRRLFFKPVAGHGSKAVYRGDKLTRRVWEEILAGEYVAQETVMPSERSLRVANEPLALKFDVRAYVYAGTVQLLAARLYQGQTTNFRTAGGGFAPVFHLPAGRQTGDGICTPKA